MIGPKVERFWAKVDTSSPDGCWPWTAARNLAGYGKFDHQGAHRYALEQTLGRPLAPGMFALHRCDNPPCCRPSHLFEGTNQDNVDDRQAKGRQATGERAAPKNPARGDRHPARAIPGFRAGERNGRHRLTADDVREIRQRLAAGVWRWIDIAHAFGVSKATVSHIAAGRTWTGVT